MGQAVSDGQQIFEFRNVTEAIRVLRSGKKDARWYAAAEFLISRATPEVQLMIEVGQALGERREDDRQRNAKKSVPWRTLIIGVATLVSIILIGYGIGKLVGVSCA